MSLFWHFYFLNTKCSESHILESGVRAGVVLSGSVFSCRDEPSV